MGNGKGSVKASNGRTRRKKSKKKRSTRTKTSPRKRKTIAATNNSDTRNTKVRVLKKIYIFVCSLIFTSLVNLLLQFFIIRAFPLVNVLCKA